MLTKVQRYIKQQRLLTDDERVVVALSGGADSVALLRILMVLGREVEAAHCNFHLRGDESDRDEQFVTALCRALGVRLRVAHFDTMGEARRTGKSIEMAARDLRYEWFASLGCAVAVAHHIDDNAETMLLNLIRGTGIDGLTGIRPMRALEGGGRLVRPLLCVSRQEIIMWLEAEGAVGELPLFVTDSTNNEDEARRNIIRHHVMPVLRQLNPSASKTIAAVATRLDGTARLAQHVLHSTAEACFDGTAIDVGVLMSSLAPHTTLYYILSERGFSGSQCDDIFDAINGRDLSTMSGRMFHSATHRLLVHRGRLLLRADDESARLLCTVLPREGRVQVTERMVFEITTHAAEGFVIPRERSVACLDADRLTLPLVVRRAQVGDRFTPLGMRGSKLVSDYLTDRHASLFDKEDQLVVLSGDDIVWLVGRCPSQHYTITPSTRHLLCIRTSAT